jgi:hypothetical protein
MTETAKHTPGPWVMADDSLISAEEDGQAVAQVLEVLEDEKEDEKGDEEANARLIAAAPELLAALSELASCFSEDIGVAPVADEDSHRFGALLERTPTFAHLRAARAAIAKATGETA